MQGNVFEPSFDQANVALDCGRTLENLEDASVREGNVEIPESWSPEASCCEVPLHSRDTPGKIRMKLLSEPPDPSKTATPSTK